MILMPLPEEDFDPSETSIPWKIFKENNVDVTFATPNGKPGKADPKMLTGETLGIFKPALMAGKDARADYAEMTKDPKFQNPIRYDQISPNTYKAILLPGGHAKGMRPYLESKKLQDTIVTFFHENKPVGAICHGVLLVARSIDPKSQKSVLHEFKTTSLLKAQELFAYNLTRLWLDDYYLTYPITVEEEVKTFLKDKSQYLKGNSGLFRDSTTNTKPAFVSRDRNYLSARWPGDAHLFAYEFLKMIP
jgi:putative intracellular protease/amidase